MTVERSPNRLIDETSPYLRQHAYNPVRWYPWGEEALALARAQDRPIFLSIGYSACHWCHVMERECFENEAIAALMNQHYVNIKVDREERPDVDDIYMKAVVALNGSGGWPMSVFLTPDLRPFFGATYLPPVRAHGRPSFPDVLVGLANAYEHERDKVVDQAQQLTAAIEAEAQHDARGRLPDDILDRSLAQLRQRFDAQWGGFGAAPKFPRAGDVRLCLRHHQRLESAEALLIATRTLDAMAQGGMYDQLGGGFHRYSVDREWRVPHFEKMLYDNAQLLAAYLEAFTLTKKPEYAQVARGICEWALREMQTADGGFASSQDADSEGEEGRFFVWTQAELMSLLGSEQGRIVASYFDVSEGGNFEDGKSVLWIPRPASDVAAQLGISGEELSRQVAEAKARLLTARDARVRPGTDDKVLTAWNALFVSALAMAHQVLDEPRYLTAAQRCMRFVLERLTQADGSLYGTFRDGRAHVEAGLDDYAFVIQALCDLYEASFDADYLERALIFKDMLEERFADPTLGGYFTTAADQADLIVRLKSSHDNALPSGAAIQALNLARLAAFTGKTDLRGRAEMALFAQGGVVQRAPYAFSHLLIAEDFLRGNPREVVIAGELGNEATQAMLRAVRGIFRPQRVVALAHTGAETALLPLLEGKTPGATGARAYVCEDQRCLEPVETPEALQAQLIRQRGWA
ncbi:MAG TPA: thioredoxin domain-containing protein [Polyangiales bacterium]|nr:thioredoxin domain-containing protein [Polyangiales bacterium]